LSPLSVLIWLKTVELFRGWKAGRDAMWRLHFRHGDDRADPAITTGANAGASLQTSGGRGFSLAIGLRR
jgi:hypothetical protein